MRKWAATGVVIALVVGAGGVALRDRDTSKDHVVSTQPEPAPMVDRLAAGRWRSQSSSVDPMYRMDPAKVWTGNELVMFGPAEPWKANDVGVAYNPATRQWRRIAAAPIAARGGAAVVWTGTKMLVWGGESPANPPVHATVFNDGAAYDPQSNSWQVIPPAPLSPRVQSLAAWTGQELVVVDGIDVCAATKEIGPCDGSHQRALFDGAAYNPTTDTWRKLPDFPHDVILSTNPGVHAIGDPTHGGDVLAIGGADAKLITAAAVYSPATNTWQEIGAPPAEWSLVRVGNTTYQVTGLANPDAPELQVHQYDPETRTWSTRGPALPLGCDGEESEPPAPIAGPDAIFVQCHGDFTSTGPPETFSPRMPTHDSFYAFNLLDNTWTKLPDMPVSDDTVVWTGHELLALARTSLETLSP
jgi:N-acetylneuraminic acid mutarotase